MISLIYCYVFPFKMTQLTISSGRIIVRDLQYLRITQPGNVTCEPALGRGMANTGSPVSLHGHGRELNEWQWVNTSEQNPWLGEKLPAGWESQHSLMFTSVLLCDVQWKHAKGDLGHLP